MQFFAQNYFVIEQIDKQQSMLITLEFRLIEYVEITVNNTLVRSKKTQYC